jgi:hypothetical protein
MAIINWLNGMNIDDRIELDELLSVKIPAFTTPKRTKKMLAVTAIAYPSNSYLNSRNVRDYTKVYYISDLLDQQSSNASDEHLLDVAGNWSSQIDISELAPSKYNELQSTIDYYDRLIQPIKSKIETLEDEIERKKYSLNIYNSIDVNNYNEKINKIKNLLEIEKSYINTIKTKINEMNNMDIRRRGIASIGGGINLRPSEFKRISRNRNAPKLRELRKVKGKIKTVGKVAKSGDWIRNISSGISGSRINKLSTNSWTSSKSVNGGVEYNYHSNSGDYASMSHSLNLQKWQLKTSVNGSVDKVQYSIASNLLQVYHGGSIIVARGRISSDGKRIVFQ